MCLALISACNFGLTSPKKDFQVVLDAGRAKWAHGGLHSYEYDYALTCACDGDSALPVHIVVKADTILSVVLSGPPGGAASSPKSSFHTVLQMFDLVEANISASGLQIALDSVYGYTSNVQYFRNGFSIAYKLGGLKAVSP